MYKRQTEAREPNERGFSIMPVSGHLFRVIDIYPPQEGGKRTAMHRTKTLDYVVVIEGEVVLLLDDTELTLNKGDVVVQLSLIHISQKCILPESVVSYPKAER